MFKEKQFNQGQAALKTRNASIDIFRLICAALVCAIHIRPFGEINKTIAFFYNEILSRIAVPFFFCVSGYYFIGKLLRGEKPFLRTVKSLLQVYGIWSFIYIFVDFLFRIQNSSFVFRNFAIESALGFLIRGTFEHFWFFPALFFSVFIAALLKKHIRILFALSVLCYLIGLLGCSYYYFGTQIPIISTIESL